MKKLKNMIKHSILNKIYFPPKIVSRTRTSEMLVAQEKLSLVRYGDGELGQIINQNDIGFQKYNADLVKRLREILEAEDDPNILVCIPDVFGKNIYKLKPEPKDYWMKWIIANRAKLKNYFKKGKIYGDSLVSRLYLPWIDKSDEAIIVNNFKTIWNNKKIIIVEGEKTRWGVGNDLLAKTRSVKRIICPAENAFLKYDEILFTCMKYSIGVDLFILAIGPTATILAYDLAKAGVRALDLGHFDLQYEYLIRQLDSREKIVGKYNNELQDSNVEKCSDEIYVQSIIAKIGC